MAKLYGAQKMVLQAILNAQGDTSSYIDDSKLAQATQIALSDMRNWLLTLDHEEYVDLALTNSGLSASITPKGRLTLGIFRPIASTPARAQNPPHPASRRGRESPGHRGQRLSIADPETPRRRQRRSRNRQAPEFREGRVHRPEPQVLVDGAVTQQSVMDTLERHIPRCRDRRRRVRVHRRARGGREGRLLLHRP